MYDYTTLFSKINLTELESKLKSSRSIVITAHKSPDGDAVGSTLALWNVLTKIGLNATVVLPDGFPAFLSWMNGADKIVLHDKETKKAEELILNADVLFSLDYNDFSRTGKMADALRKSEAFKVMIDHHPDPSNETNILVSSTAECATAQMVFQFIASMGWKKNINVKAAECIYCGMMTDTGSFRFSSTTAKTHFIVAELMAIGLDNTYVHNAVFDNDSETRLRLLGYALSEKMKILPELKASYFILTAQELKKFGYKTGDTEGLVNYGLAVKGVMMSAIFIEGEEQIKISFRSKGKVPVNEFSRSWFNGGGHTNAAGGSLNCNLKDAESLFLEKLPSFIKQYV